MRWGYWALCALAIGLGGCDGGSLPGSYWNVEVVGATDACHATPVDYTGPTSFEYRVEYSGAAVSISLGEDQFATGAIAGCSVEYASVVWGEAKGGYDIKWQLFGDALFRAGGTACDLSDGVDWEGTETFLIVDSDNPDLEEGCTYELDMIGTFAGTVE